MTKITSDAQALAYLDTPDPKMQELRAYLAARLASTSLVPDELVDKVGAALYIYWFDVNEKCRDTYRKKIREALS